MALRSPELDRIADQVKKHLPEYLESLNIRTDRGEFFQCLSKYHDDKDPSMHVIPGSEGTELKCFGCGEHMDAFSVAFHLEGKPLDGAEFIHENLFYLADKYGIPHDDIQFTAEEVEEFKARRFMRDVALVFKEFLKSDDAHPHATKRDWTPGFCRQMQIGTIRKPTEFYKAVKDAGMWTDKDLVNLGLKADREKRIPRLFGPNMLTFLVSDHAGQPVGFASRNYGNTGPKYCNTAAWNENTQAGCKIYNKSAILYGLDLATNMTHQRLDIFEGYSDLASARKIGLEAVCAMGSTAFTEEHLEILKRLGFTHINFVMDDDVTGRAKMTGNPDKINDRGYLGIASGHEGVKVTVSMLPFGDEVSKDFRDPDAYFKTHTVEDYLRELVIYDAFDWELERVKASNMAPEEILDRMIDFLGSDADFIARRLKAKKLANATNFPVDDIIREFERRFNKEADVQIDQALYRVSRAKNTKDKLSILQAITDKLALDDTEVVDLSQVEVIDDFKSFLETSEDENRGLAGWDCGFHQLNEATNGIPKTKKWMAVAGGANVGKSALVLNICWGVARNLANENVTAAYLSLDDDRHTAYAKLIATECRLPINDCSQPHKRIYKSSELIKRYKEARDKLFELIKSGRISCKGEESGNTPQLTERWVQELQDKFGTNVLLVVDSFNNLEMPGVDPNNDRIRLASLSSWLRRTTQAHNYAAVVTMEERKLGQGELRGRLKDLLGSGKMSYDLKFAGMAYNDLHTRREDATFYWKDEYGNRMPYLEFAIEKNKLSGYKGDITFKFIPDQARVEEIPYTIARNLRAEADEGAEGETFTAPEGGASPPPPPPKRAESIKLDFIGVGMDIPGE